MSKQTYSNIVFGLIMIICGQAIAIGGTVTQADTFPAFRWAGWVVSLAGVVFLAYGIYGLLSKIWKPSTPKKDPEQNDESE